MTPTIVGTGADDILVGTDEDDVIFAGAGNDRVLALGGDDFVCSNAGNDFVDGGAGNDALFADAVMDGQDVYVGGPGEDIVDYGLRSISLRLSLNGAADDGAPGENDNIGSNDSTAPDADGIEVVVGSTADDVLLGGPGNDRFIGRSGNDHIDGGPGVDGLGGFEGNDLLVGGEGNDQLGGGEEDDTIVGGPGNDLMTGGFGNDRFVADPDPDGHDTMFGFGGVDLITYADRAAGVTAKVNDPNGASEDYVTPDVENIVGSRGDDIIEMTTRGADLANNDVDGGPGNDIINVVDGTKGNDQVDGGLGVDRCRADAGDTLLRCP
nr:calcium-binding protein [Kibdelosporangium sp. MJ126-NF4]CEL12778.1 Alkaline phosphatase [Kibdelosporangium sp. MJ126-NF4]CTQ98464.1 Alkaline phosphatase (EC 3.1.3.1) [Kibdelosporangium sp. MJ126-NF4]